MGWKNFPGQKLKSKQDRLRDKLCEVLAQTGYLRSRTSAAVN